MFDSDSRIAALGKYSKRKLGWLFNTSTFTGNLVIALIAAYFFRQLGFGEAVDYVVLVGVLAIGLWITEAIPPFAVGILIIALLLFGFGTDYVLESSSDVDIYLDTWTSNVIWLLLGGFFLAKGMKVAQLDKSLFSYTLKRFGRQPKKLLLGLMLVTAFGSMVMSNTATTAMMISSVLPLVYQLGKTHAFSKSILVGIPAAATVGGIGTIIGSTPNAIAVGALQEIGIHLTFLDWMVFGLPTALILVFSFYKILVKSVPETFEDEAIDWDKITQEEKVKKKNKKAVTFTLIITISLWMTEPLHGIPVAATSAIPIVFLTLSQVITAEEVRSLPWDTLMLVAGGLALGIAVVEVGLSNIIMDNILSFSILPVGVAMIFAFLGVMLSNVMSNTAASAILVPLGLTLTGLFGITAPIIIAISCSCSLLFPVSTPANAIAYATGLVEQKSFRKGGFYFMISGPIVAFITVFIWGYFMHGWS